MMERNMGAHLADASSPRRRRAITGQPASCGARHARSEVLDAAKTLAAPMVLTLKAKDGLEHDNPYQVGQSGLIGNPAAHLALHKADTLFLVDTDFPYRDWLPHDKKVVQLDSWPEHIGRRVTVATALVGEAH